MRTATGSASQDGAPAVHDAASAVISRPPGLRSQRLWGIVIWKECWGLSVRGWVLVIILVTLGVRVLLSVIHPFLVETYRVNTDVLVVEGWVHDFAIRGGAAEFNRGAYQHVFTTGGPATGIGTYTGDEDTTANVGANLLRNAGVPPAVVQVVSSRILGRDRTYSSALALREWFRENKVVVHNLNVVTEGVHARRTRLLFQKAFGKTAVVGVIAVLNPDYDAKHWWRYSEGVREVTGETIAYLYAKLFFHPSEPTSAYRLGAER